MLRAWVCWKALKGITALKSGNNKMLSWVCWKALKGISFINSLPTSFFRAVVCN